MSVLTWKLTFSQSGKAYELLTLHLPTQSLDEASLHLPGGAYTTFRTFDHRKALRLEDHLRRLEQTAELTGQPQNLDRGVIRYALSQALEEVASLSDDWRIRLTLDLQTQPGVLFLSFEPLQTLPAEAYQNGILAVTRSLERQLPKAKLTRFISRANSVRQELPSSINEVIMVDAQGCLLEGLSSNFFAVRDGVLFTADEGVLNGVTRALVLQAADRLKIAIQFTPVSMAEISQVDEAFITSASRGVLPVRQIDRVQIGDLCPGKLSRQLMHTYQVLIDEQLEMI